MWPEIEAIEIGNLTSDDDLGQVLKDVSRRGLRWGIHAPLRRDGLKRVLLDSTGLSADAAVQIERDVAIAAAQHAEYVLVHCPWFADDGLPFEQAKIRANNAVLQLEELQERYNVQLVLEFKLGVARNPGLLSYLIRNPSEFLDLEMVTCCLDVGDWLLASEALGVDPMLAFEPLAGVTSVIHVHTVERTSTSYVWKPIHPSDPDALAVRGLCETAMRKRKELRVVFEHTPHLDPGLRYDLEGYAWLVHSLTGTQLAPTWC